MRKRISNRILILSSFLSVFIFTKCSVISKSKRLPYQVKKELFNQNELDSLGLHQPKNIETITVFKPNDSTDHFSNGVVMTVFKNVFYCQWQSSSKDEDSNDTWVAYSKSLDGKNWSTPKILSPSLDKGISTSGGWWIKGDTLVAYINEWPSNISPKGGFTFYKTSVDGLNWSDKKPVLMADGTPMNAVFEQDSKALKNGRIINAAHFQPGLIAAPVYTDDPLGIRGWKRASFKNLSIKNNVSREIEPSWFLQENSNLVMIFRDQNSSFFNLASISKDNGETWTTPKITAFPDSRSKQSAGNLANGFAYIINNPVQNKVRMPLAITLSKDGNNFKTAYVIRKGSKNIQQLRYKGKYKRLGYHYPKSFIFKDFLYVSYATNKEDVEFSKIPLASLTIK